MSRMSTIVWALCVIAVMSGCSGPENESTLDTPASTSTAPDTTVATTVAPTTTFQPANTSTVVENDTAQTTPVAGDPPTVELKEPGGNELLTPDELASHFVFSMDISSSHTTTFTAFGTDQAWSVTARTDGETVHYLSSGILNAGEIIERGSQVWYRDDTGEWVIDEDLFELPIYIAFPSPDLAYGVAYQIFGILEFDGWIETDGAKVAVYTGGAEAAAQALASLGEDSSTVHEGQVEVWWSPPGYFAKVAIETMTDRHDLGFEWTVTDVGTTEVEPPS